MLPAVLSSCRSLLSIIKKDTDNNHESDPIPSIWRKGELNERLKSYTFGPMLGKGAFGRVYLAKASHRHDNRLVAVKVVRRAKLTKKPTRLLAASEVRNLARMSATKSMFFTQLSEAFCDSHNLYLVTDYLQGGTLRLEMYRRGCNMKNDRIVFIMAQLVEILRQLRIQNIIHRDIKPDNILLDDCGNLTLGDFGMSRCFIESDAEANSDKESRVSSVMSNGQFLSQSGCGTLAYAAPEMIRGEPYSFEVDIYSVGVVFYELLFGSVPYTQNDRRKIMKAMESTPFSVPADCIVNPVVLNLCKRLLEADPTERIDLTGLKNHLFFGHVQWETLATRTYLLPSHHYPPPKMKKATKKYMNRLKSKKNEWIHPVIFMNPTLIPTDDPESALDRAYNTYLQSPLLTQRRREKSFIMFSFWPVGTHKVVRSLKDGATLGMLGIKKRLCLYIGFDKEFRCWERDVSSSVNEEPFVQVLTLKASEPVPKRSTSADAQMARQLASIDTGKEGKARQTQGQKILSLVHPDHNSTLRRVTARIPIRILSPTEKHQYMKPRLMIETKHANHGSKLLNSTSHVSGSIAQSPNTLSEENFRRALGLSAISHTDIETRKNLSIPKIEISLVDRGCKPENSSHKEDLKPKCGARRGKPGPSPIITDLPMSTTWTAESSTQSLSKALSELSNSDSNRNGSEMCAQPLKKTESVMSTITRGSIISTSTSLPSLVSSAGPSRTPSIITTPSITTPRNSYFPDVASSSNSVCEKMASPKDKPVSQIVNSSQMTALAQTDLVSQRDSHISLIRRMSF